MSTLILDRTTFKRLSLLMGLMIPMAFVAAAEKKPGKANIPPRPKLDATAIGIVLDKPAGVRFEQTPLRDVMEFLIDFCDVKIELDAKALKAAGVEEDLPISFKADRTTMRNVLKSILDPLNLEAVIKKDRIVITTRAPVMLSERISKWLANAYKNAENANAIAKALDISVSVQFVETSLDDFLKFFSDQTKVEFELDEKALKAAGVGKATRISFRAEETSVRAALKSVLDPLKLEAVIRGDRVVITQQTAADKSAKNDAAAKALDKTVSLDFSETPLSDVVKFFSDYAKVKFELDEKGLKAAGVKKDSPITFHAEGTPLKSALKRMLDPLKLEAKIEKDRVMITNKKEKKGRE